MENRLLYRIYVQNQKNLGVILGAMRSFGYGF